MYVCVSCETVPFPSPGEVRRRDPSSEKGEERGHPRCVSACTFASSSLSISRLIACADSSLSTRSVRSRDDEGDDNDDDDDGDNDDDGDDSAGAGATLNEKRCPPQSLADLLATLIYILRRERTRVL